ncbi:uncharacterized protein LOC132170184 [Corylus avellana]|uniref:uncharacterized protein LOC132170184 n=1 Tax=Corylus avellana TaxID=13451 RepID=UPI00286B100D|nr:uncharacterized protein LOC132170184 [Corylus avellana]
MFIWRACHNMLPTKSNLCKKKVLDSPSCPICHLEEESTEHILWYCPSASDVWSCGPITVQKSICGNGHFIHLFEDLIDRYEQQELELFAVRATAQPEGPEISIHHPQVIRWQPPPVSSIKVNWDAALDQRRCCVGLGVLARDAEGRFLMACGIKKIIEVEPTTAEALAALHAVIFATEMGYSNVIFEGDAFMIVNAINSRGICESNYGHFVEDVKRLLGEFNLSSFVHVSRGANCAAHNLAKEACTHVADKHWWHCIPSCIDGIIRKEETPLPLS